MSALSHSVGNVRKSVSQGDWGSLVTRISSMVMPLGILAMIGLMVVPVPTWLLDLLLTLNLAVGAVMLMASVLVSSGTRLSSFPSLLLITTLFRLALDISATRLILGEADAGEVIRSFGDFATGGSLIVGLVIFLIITLVQLIVISKGAEHAANATARMVNDSMPGRQMSIDAELQRNLITKEQAAEARHQMDLEMQFYGRMVGATNFIKGDAIASLVISAINILGGFIVGVAVRKVSLSEAAETYTLLTVGSGLVSQIPALVTSISAGILITRVAERKREHELGEMVAFQFLAVPKALILAGLMLCLIGIAPGMPMLPFWVLGISAGAVGLAISNKPSSKSKDEAETPLQYGAVPLVRIDVHPDLLERGEGEAAALRRLNSLCNDTQLRHYSRSGVPVPKVVVRTDKTLKARSFAIFIGPECVFQIAVPGGKMLVNSPPAARSLYPGAQAEGVFDDEFYWVPVEQAPQVQRNGHTAYEGAQSAAIGLSRVLTLYCSRLIGIQETQTLLDVARSRYPALADTVVGPPGSPAILTSVQLAQILRMLVEERVPILNFRTILEVIASAAPSKISGVREPVSTSALVENIRIALKEETAAAINPNVRSLNAVFKYFTLARPLLIELEGLSGENYAVSTPKARVEAGMALRQKIGIYFKTHKLSSGPVIISAPQRHRRVLWELLRILNPNLMVVGSEELPSGLRQTEEIGPPETDLAAGSPHLKQ